MKNITLQGGPYDGVVIGIDDKPSPVTYTKINVASTRTAGPTWTYTIDRKTLMAGDLPVYEMVCCQHAVEP